MAKEKVQDEFSAYAEEVAREEAESASKRAGGHIEYEKLKWTGLEKGKLKIIRALGGVPNSKADKFTARTIRTAKVIADNGKTIKLVLPVDDENYIVNRIIERVCEVEWTKNAEGKNEKKYIQQTKNPEIFEMVMYNGLDISNPKRKFGLEGKGWWGREAFIMNCLDREPTMYAWHKEKKHSALLSKNINTIVGKDGEAIEFVDDGVPSYGFTNILALNLFKFYGDWKGYDIGIERTGLTSPPMRIINASKHLEEVPEELQEFVVEGPLTDEEKSWEMYDLDKLFNVTSYTKLWNRLKLSIAKIDAALGSHYMDELKGLVDQETAERDAKRATEKSETDPEEETVVAEVVETRAAVVEERVSVSASKDVTPENLPAWKSLTDVEKAQIVKVEPATDGKGYTITYNTEEKQYRCPQCHTPAPASFAKCPGCGFGFQS